MEIKIFKVDRNSSFKFGLPRQVNWNLNPSIALHHQINNNYYNLRRLHQDCLKFPSEVTTIVNINQIYYSQPYLTTKSQCEKFISRASNYMELEKLDLDAIYQTDFDVELYSVIILYQGEYYGHIYCWVSNENPDYCFFIGIRNRIDSIFLENTDKQLSGVSKYLIDGVKQFAQSQGCQKITVVYPEPIMKIILPKMGFFPDPVPISWFGQSVQTIKTNLDLLCDNCLSLNI